MTTYAVFFRLIVVAFVISWCGQIARSAEVTVVPPRGDFPTAIIVEGIFEYGDDTRFRSALSGVDQAMVVFNSEGGSLDAGLEIGKAIRMRGLVTGVLSGNMCMSACALAWLGGASRFADTNAIIGFHAAYTTKFGVARETGAGNARVGAYLANLGLSEQAAYWLASRSPDEDMLILTPQIAQELKIDVYYLDAKPQTERDRSGQGVVAGEEDTQSQRAVRLALANISAAANFTPGAYARFIDENYADPITYFGKVTSKADVIAEAQRYKTRWPSLTYSLAREPVVQCQGDACDVSGEARFHAKSEDRNAHSWGTFTFWVHVREQAGRPLIVAEASKVVTREFAALHQGETLPKRVQTALSRLGCRPGPIDGVWGPSSRAALSRFAAANRLNLPLRSPSDAALRALQRPDARRCAGGQANTGFKLPW